MDIQFQDRRTAWRGRGRPPRQPSARVLELLRYTATTGTVATIALDDTTGPADIREMLADLRAAARVLGGQVKHQIVAGQLRFFWDPEGSVAA